MSRAERLALIDRHDPALPVTRQCGLMTVSRSSVYRPPAPASDEDLAIMALIDRQYLARPYYGSRRMTAWLATQGHRVNRKRVRRLMRQLGLVATDQRSQFTSDAFTGVLSRHEVTISTWMARGAAWTTSSSSGCGAASNTRRSTCTPMAASPRLRPALGSGWSSTTRSANIRAMAITRRGKCTKHNAGGYVDDRLCRPAALPPLPEPARKAGKCSPSPTSPPAQPPTQGLIKRVLKVE